jgi:hypothetical protein
VHVHRHLPNATHADDPADVIEVGVGEPDRSKRGARLSNQIDQGIGFGARIDEHRLVRRFIDDEIRVL